MRIEAIFPLADKLRPACLDDFVGQEHLVGRGKVIRSLMNNQSLPSLIFWGPPGTGKTTLSRIIVRELQLPAEEFAATVSKLQDAREIMQLAAMGKKETGKPLVLFVDEIHHFNKSSQDAFLSYVERGDIILLGTTTENPAYKMNRALLSRLKILEFHSMSDQHLQTILLRGLDIIQQTLELERFEFSRGVINIFINFSQGDARRLLNLLETVFSVYPPTPYLTETMIMDVIQQKNRAYDRKGDDRYQLISAFHKSVRNSDCDAALFWLYRMIEGGEDPLYILRRMIRICVEDIGFADPGALKICLDAKTAFEFLGSPEGNLFLTQATVYLAAAPKSNSLYITEMRMKELVEKYAQVPVPLQIINPDNFIAVHQGAGKGYRYAHDFKEKTTRLTTIPDEIKEKDFFRPQDMGFEKKIKERLEYWQRIKESLKKQD